MKLEEIYTPYDLETYHMEKFNRFREIADVTDEDEFMAFFQFMINDAQD